MNHEEAESYYQSLGLTTEHVEDPPGKLYPAHAHQRTILLSIAGSVAICLDRSNEWLHLIPGVELTIATGQTHEARVGEEGWEYVAAWDAEEAKAYANVSHG